MSNKSRLINFLKGHKYFLGGLVVLAWVIFINLFPEGYVISSTDTSQVINIKENFGEYFFEFSGWFLYMGALRLLSFMGLGDTINLSATLGFFIFGSYLSFYFFSKLLFKTSDFLRSAFSLIYALNVFTLYTFTMHGLGYTCFFYLYIFIPLLIGLYIKFLKTNQFLFLALFCLSLFLAAPGFFNPAFALGLAIVLFLLTMVLLVAKEIEFNRKMCINLFLITILAIFVSAFWVFPFYPRMKGGVEELNTTNETNLISSLIERGNLIYSTFGLSNGAHDYFPFNFPYKNLIYLRNIFIYLTYLPILFLASSIFLVKKMNSKKLFFMSLAIFLFLMLGVGKMIYPFETINYFVFIKLWGLNTLRAYDKLAIFLPFFLILPVFIFFLKLQKTKYYKFGIVLLFLIVITPLPFYFGKLQQNISIRFSDLSPEKKNFKTSRLTFLVKIPEEYYKIKNLVDRQEKYFISTLPNNLGWTGTGSSSYPKWKLNGFDVTQKISGQRYIEANLPYFEDWNFTEEFNESNTNDNSWIVKTLGMMNAKYIIYHKDAPSDAVEKTIGKMKDLERRGLIKNMEENDYFILYGIHPDYFLPYLSWQTENISIQGNSDSIERNFAKIKNSFSEVNFQEINPKKFVVDFENNAVGKNLILAETFNPLWKAYYILDSGREIEIESHFVARGYANGWQIDPPISTAQIVIEYYPTRLMWRGLVISLATVLFLVVYLLILGFKRLQTSDVSRPE